MFIVGITLLVVDIAYRSYLTKQWARYANWGEVNERLDDINWENPHEQTDSYLVWMLRSKEYKSANENAKHNMRTTWADDYRDRYIGRFVRLCFFWLCLGICGFGAFCPYDPR